MVKDKENTYNLRVNVHRKTNSNPSRLKITYFPDPNFSGVPNIETNIYYLNADVDNLSFYIPIELIMEYSGYLGIKIQNEDIPNSTPTIL